jgi:succinyl-diaminopimelate desuccinylase
MAGDKRFQIDQEEMVQLLTASLKINTTNPPGAELPLAELWGKKMEELGLEVRLQPVAENRANVIGVLKGKGKKPSLLYNGHLDTVPPGAVEWDYGPFSGEIVGDRVYGRGAADMKSGVVAMIMAAGALKAAGIELQGDLIIAATAGEETDSIGARAFAQEEEMKNVGAILIGEPSHNEMFVAEKGALWFKIRTRGKTAHGSMPHLGRNAILHMNRIISQLAQYEFKYEEHPLLGAPTMNIGTIAGGVTTNVVPDQCELTIDMRTVPGQKHGEIEADLEKMIAKLRQELPVLEVGLAVINDRPAVDTASDHEFVQLGLKVAEAVQGKQLVPGGVNYYTDAAVFVPDTDLPMFILGPGKAELAHQPNEYVEISKLVEAAQYYAAFAGEYLK